MRSGGVDRTESSSRVEMDSVDPCHVRAGSFHLGYGRRDGSLCLHPASTASS